MRAGGNVHNQNDIDVVIDYSSLCSLGIKRKLNGNEP